MNRIRVSTLLRDWPARLPDCPLTQERREAVTLLAMLTNEYRLGTPMQHGWHGDVPLRVWAYIWATVRHETAATFRPVKEFAAKPGTRTYRLQQRYWPSGFYGRGYVQLTWEKNYQQMTERLREVGTLDETQSLVSEPDLARDPSVAFVAMVLGMREGLFTGVSLGTYITDTENAITADPPEAPKTDYVNARRVVNGVDQAERIAAYATQFELLLRGATRS